MSRPTAALRRSGRSGWSPAALAGPYLVGTALLVAVPLVMAAGLAFTDYTGLGGATWVGAGNLRRMLDSEPFRQAVVATVVIAAVAVPLRVAAAAGLALLLHRRARGVGAARAAVYLPSVLPDAAYALLWLWLLNPLYGPLPAAVEALGLPSPAWLTDPWAARLAVAGIGAFQIGEGFVVALAWRRTFAAAPYEAAALAGASPWYTLRRVTLPQMAPVLGLLALRDLVLVLSITFVPALLLTGGGPDNATTALPLHLYEAGFRYFRLGYASAVSLVLLVASVAIIWCQYRLARRWRIL